VACLEPLNLRFVAEKSAKTLQTARSPPASVDRASFHRPKTNYTAEASFHLTLTTLLDCSRVLIIYGQPYGRLPYGRFSDRCFFSIYRIFFVIL